MTTFGILGTVLSEVVTQASCIHFHEATLQEGSQEQGWFVSLADSLMWEEMTDILKGEEK